MSIAKEDFATELDTLLRKYASVAPSEIKEVLDRVVPEPVVAAGKVTTIALKSPKKT